MNNERVRWLNQDPPALTNDEESRLRAVIRRHCPEREAQFDLALNSGLRLSEQHGLLWKHVDWDRKLATIELGKGSGRIEHVVLNSQALRALSKLRARLGPGEAEAAEQPVCEGTAWDHREWWDDVRREAGVKDFDWHDLRHTFASRLVMRDVNILAVQKLMRHATLSVTLRYAHLAPSHLHEAVEKLCAAASVAASVTGVSDATQKPRQILQ